MRLRRNWQGEAALPEMPGVLGVGVLPKPVWQEVFGREKPLHVEIGMGKGDFLLAMAAKHPGIDFVGIERSLSILYIAAQKNREQPLANLRFLPVDAEELGDYFMPGQVERIYLNFSDPWPKRRHGSRRLTARGKLGLYRQMLGVGGQIHLKTDQRAFFIFSLGELIREGWSVGKMTEDLHRSGYEGNVATEYELRFHSLGQPIYRMEAWRP